MNDFSFTPYGDRYFAQVARRHGLLPRHVAWTTTNNREDATAGGDAPTGMPPFAYFCRARPQWKGDAVAHLVIYMDRYNYYRNDGEIGLTLHDLLLPDTMLTGLPGMDVARVVNDPLLAGMIVASVKRVDEERRQLMLMLEDVPAG